MCTHLTDQTYNWVIGHIHEKCRMKQVSRLKGGISSRMYAMTIQTEKQILEVVLRQIDHQAWLEEEPDVMIHEAKALQTAATLSVGTPKVIAYDPTGNEAGLPTLMMSRLSGEINLLHRNQQDYLQQ